MRNTLKNNDKKLLTTKVLSVKMLIVSNDEIRNGPLVKRLRHRPFTAVTRVRVP